MSEDTRYIFKDMELNKVTYLVSTIHNTPITLYSISKSTNSAYPNSYINPNEAAELLISNVPINIITSIVNHGESNEQESN